MNKAGEYTLKLDYTAEELEELKELSKAYNSPMTAVWRVAGVRACNDPFRYLRRKYRRLDIHKEFDFMTDINNVIMGTAIFSEEEYVVHDKVTDQYICYSVKKCGLFWRQLEVAIPYKNTQKWWLAINPAYEPMLEKVEDNE